MLAVNMDRQIAIFAHLPIFSELEPRSMEAVATLARDVAVSAGTVLMREGEAAESLAYTRDGTLGRLFYAEADYWHRTLPRPVGAWSHRQAVVGSSLLSAGCHAVDALRWLVGEIVEVHGYSARPATGSKYEFESNIVATLKFENGAIGKVSSILECQTPYVFNVRLLGDDGTALNDQVFSPGRFPGQPRDTHESRRSCQIAGTPPTIHSKQRSPNYSTPSRAV